MTNKIEIEKEQAYAFEKLVGHNFQEEHRDSVLKQHVLGWIEPYESLNKLSVEDIIKLFNGEYTIKKDIYKVGEWATRTGSSASHEQYREGLVFQIKEVSISFLLDSLGFYHDREYVRPSTEEEILRGELSEKFAKLGRYDGEFKDGDIIETISSKLSKIKSDGLQGITPKNAKELYDRGKVIHLYSVQSRILTI